MRRLAAALKALASQRTPKACNSQRSCAYPLNVMLLKIALLPFKLLFLPIIAVVVIVKFAVLLALCVAFGAVILAILIPLAVLFLILVGPILLISALT